VLLFRQLVCILVFSSVLIFFQNCSSGWQVQSNQILGDSFASSVDVAEICENELLKSFSKTWHPLLVSYCNECHAYSHGSRDIKLSFDGFKSRGENRIQNNLTTIHKGRNYSRNLQIVNEFMPQWNEAKMNYQSCLSGE